MTKVKNNKKILTIFLILLMAFSFCLGGCVIKGTIDNNFLIVADGGYYGVVLSKDNNYTGTCIINKVENGNKSFTYSGTISGTIRNQSTYDYRYVSLKFAIYSYGGKLITQLEKSIGDLGNRNNSDDSQLSLFVIDFSVNSTVDIDVTNDGSFELTYAGGWQSLPKFE